MTEPNPCIFGPLLGPLHDGELSDDRRQEVLHHLQSCAHCPAELADIRRFAGVLQSATPAAPAAGRLDAIFADARRQAALPAAVNDLSVDPVSADAASNPRPMSMPAATSVPAAKSVSARAAEPAHLRYVRWASGIAAAIFLLAMGQLLYVNVGDKPDPGTPYPTPQTHIEKDPAPPATTPVAGSPRT